MVINDLAELRVIRTDGREETHQVGRRIALDWCRRMIDAVYLDVVDLHDGRIMLVDDSGLIDNKPINKVATAMYWGVCWPGTTNPICGDVVIANDKDFGDEDA
jgi:hypothetical protein